MSNQADNKRHRRAASGIKCAYALVILTLVYLVQVDGQFFTKSSSKSIPRMGRRSISVEASAPNDRQDSNRHSLIDLLIDEYGPNMARKIEETKITDTSDLATARADQQRASYLSSEQPTISDNSLENPLNRDERSSTTPVDQNNLANYRDASLAIRALNTDRYIRHLASGQPLMTFESLFGPRNQQRARQSGSGVKQAANSYMID